MAEKNAQEMIDEAIKKIITKASEASLVSDIPFDDEQLQLLRELNRFCVQQILDNPEVVRDPRKITYKSNQELKLALVAIFLARALTNHRSKASYNKEYFEKNIIVSSNPDGHKILSLAQNRISVFKKTLRHKSGGFFFYINFNVITRNEAIPAILNVIPEGEAIPTILNVIPGGEAFFPDIRYLQITLIRKMPNLAHCNHSGHDVFY